MRGKAYAIMNWKDIVEISLSLDNAQEILMDYAFDNGLETFNHYLLAGYPEDVARREANFDMAQWRIWIFSLV